MAKKILSGGTCSLYEYVRDDWSLFGVFGLFHSILTFHTLKTFTNEVLMKLGDLHDQNARILESFAKFGNMLQKLFLINFFNQLKFGLVVPIIGFTNVRHRFMDFQF